MNFNRNNCHARLTAPRSRAFTLIELVVSTLILGILFSGMLMAFHNTQENSYQYAYHERAAAVAQRRMEILLATVQEPNNLYVHGQDDLDPLFHWSLDLERILIDKASPVKSVDNTVIKATVIVEASLPELRDATKVELVRYFDFLYPMAGHEVAVPLPLGPNARWLERLREELGREPTFDEIMKELIKIGVISPEMAQELGLSYDIGDIIKDIR